MGGEKWLSVGFHWTNRLGCNLSSAKSPPPPNINYILWEEKHFGKLINPYYSQRIALNVAISLP